MQNIKRAWNLCVQNSGVVLSLIGSNIIYDVIIALINGGLARFHDNFIVSFLQLLVGIVSIILSYFILISTFHILYEAAFENRKWSFSTIFGELVQYPIRDGHWKKCLGPYLVWEALVPFCISLAALFLGLLLASGLIGSLGRNALLYGLPSADYFLYLIASWLNSPAILLLPLILIAFIFVPAALSSAASIAGFYKIAGRQLGIKDFRSGFTRPFLLGIIPITVGFIFLLIFFALFMMGMEVSPVFLILMMVLMVVLMLALFAANLAYTYTMYLKILDDIQEVKSGEYSQQEFLNQTGADIAGEVLPEMPVEEESGNSLPKLPDQTADSDSESVVVIDLTKDDTAESPAAPDQASDEEDQRETEDMESAGSSENNSQNS